MDKFFKGKLNKEIFVLLLFFLPMIILDTALGYDYEISSLISIVFTALFLRYTKKDVFKEQSAVIKKSDPLIIAALFLLAVTVQIFLFSFAFRSKALSIDNDWLSYKKLAAPVIIAPITEELTFRFASTKICIDKNTSKCKTIIFVLILLVIWNFSHGTAIDLSIIFAGLILYVIFFISGNLMYCIIFHSSLNLMYALLMSPVQNNLTFIFGNNIIFAANIILFGVLLVSVIYFLKKKRFCRAERK